MTGAGFRQFIRPLTKRQKLSSLLHEKRILRVGIDATYCIYNTMYFMKKGCSTLQIDALISRATAYCISTAPHGTSPIFVFDGQRVSVKNRSHSSLLQLVDEYEQSRYFGMKSNFTIPPAITHSIAERIRSKGFDCIVAPFEADAQLAYFHTKREIDAVLSIDADSLLFGADILLEKYDRGSDTALVTRREDVMRALDYKANDLLLLQLTCTLGGCDYSNSLRGMKFEESAKILKTLGSLEAFFLDIYDCFLLSNRDQTLNGVPIILRKHLRKMMKCAKEQTLQFPEYLKKAIVDLEKALYCFHHHVVYDSNTCLFTHLHVENLSAQKFKFQAPKKCQNPTDVHMYAEKLNSITGHNPISLIFNTQFPQSKAKAFSSESALSLSHTENGHIKL